MDELYLPTFYDLLRHFRCLSVAKLALETLLGNLVSRQPPGKMRKRAFPKREIF
jgi:hypothetical protein